MSDIKGIYNNEAGAVTEPEKDIIAQEKTYLVVPFYEKDILKETAGLLENGNRAVGFDSTKKLWFANPGANLTHLAQWLPKAGNYAPQNDSDPVAEYTAVLTAAGFRMDGAAQMDGKGHRVKTIQDKAGEKSGFYRGWLDKTAAGIYQDYRNHLEPMKWRATGIAIDKEAHANWLAELAQKQLKRDADQARSYKHQADRCALLHVLLPDATDSHPYLVRKGVSAEPELKADRKGRLVIPLKNEHGEIRTLQRIQADGTKRLKKSAEKMGNFFVVGGEIKDGEPILYAEGFATAKSVSMATGRAVVMCVDAGNLARVADKFKTLHPNSSHVILGDNDHAKSNNTGLAAAERAAVLVNGVFAVPAFSREGLLSGFTDFNDLHASQGLDAVRVQVEAAISSAAPEPEPTPAQDRQITHSTVKP